MQLSDEHLDDIIITSYIHTDIHTYIHAHTRTQIHTHAQVQRFNIISPSNNMSVANLSSQLVLD